MRTWRIVSQKAEIRENEKRDMNFDLNNELKKLLNIKVTEIRIVISVLGTVQKVWVRQVEKLEIRWWAEAIETTALLRSTEKRYPWCNGYRRGPRSDVSVGILHNPQSCSITETSIFSAISGGGVLPVCREIVGVHYSPSHWTTQTVLEVG